MSLTATIWAWQTPTKSLSKYVLLALADYADENGKCYSSLKRLTKKCGLSRSTICSHLKNLRTEGYIETEKRVSENGYQICNHYQLKIPESYLKASPPAGNSSPPKRRKLVRENDRNNINGNKTVMGQSNSSPITHHDSKAARAIMEGKR